MAVSSVHFDSKEDNLGIKTPVMGSVVWVSYHPSKDSEDSMPLPLTCIRVYEDGSWDGELEEGEA